MKKLLFIIPLLFAIPSITYAEAQTKQVCEKQKDNAGKDKEVCKTIKVHKKLEAAQKPNEVKPDSKK